MIGLIRFRRLLNRLFGVNEILPPPNRDVAKFHGDDPIGEFLRQLRELPGQRMFDGCDHIQRGVAVMAAEGGSEIADDAALKGCGPLQRDFSIADLFHCRPWGNLP